LHAELERLAAVTAQAKAALAQQQVEAEHKQSRTFQKYRAAAQTASQLIHLDERHAPVD